MLLTFQESIMSFIFWAIALIVTVLIIRAALKPDTFHIERSIQIAAPPEQVFAHINDFKSHLQWSAWEKIDPNMQRSMSEQTSGVGATYEWHGNKDIGSGKMTILESLPPNKVISKIEFFSPMKATNTVEYRLEPTTDGTLVKHAMFGRSPFFRNIICLFINVDKMVGDKFEESLLALKAACENK
jgi:uncharacterized protein YndB with AHSA1/START domain